MPILDWLDRNEAVNQVKRVPYRLLQPASDLHYGDANTENMLIQGDNLEALKALLPFYAGKVKCIYIDPPYNTQNAFEHYDDNVEHSTWLSLIYPRLELLRDLLAENGSIWVSIDDNEAHYLKVIMDEVFGRRNFIAEIIWQKIFSPKNSARHFSVDHDYLTVYAKNAEVWIPNPMPRTEKQNLIYKNPDNDQRGPWTSSDLSARNPYSEGIYPITTPSGRLIAGPPPGRYWSISQKRFFELISAKEAFDDYAEAQGWRSHRYQVLDGLETVPYVCLRLPTGGGKTLLAAHSIRVAANAYLERDFPLVLWMVPSNTIRLQTLETLKNPNHSNRQALDEAFDGRVLPMDIADFTQLRPQDVRDKAVVIVSTLATARVNNPELRHFYAHNEHLEPHFSGVSNAFSGLDLIEEGAEKGRIKFSFRNLLTLHRPLVLIDEAHNASSNLSVEVLQRINPACIVEYTATPASNSNVLFNVSAAELKAEEMIKLPIILTEHQSWESAIEASILNREKLAEAARRDREYIRPIVLIQAENKNRDVSVDVIRNYLVDRKIAPEKIAIATGEQRELDGINLFDPHCPIEFVITVQALKEGWDCSTSRFECTVATEQNT